MLKNKLFLKLTYFLEGFTHIVPVPMAVYFTMAVGAFKSEREAIGILLSGFICGVIMVSVGSISRWFRLEKTFKNFESSNSKEDFKIDLLNHSFMEAKVIAGRWLTGVPIAHLIYILGWGVEKDLHISIPFVMLFTAPISYMAHLFITERVIEEFIRENSLGEVKLNLESNRIKKMSYFQRIIVSLFSIISMPFILLGYFLYASYAGYVHLENPLPHIAILGLSTFIPLIITAIYLAGSVRKGLFEVEKTLSGIARGNFNHYLPLVNTNEFGRQSIHINSVIHSLKKLYDELKYLNENLEKKVEDRTNELKESLEYVKELKFKQDGDYFLTSLLLKPFLKTKIKSNYLKLEYAIKQKKEFEFNEKNYEIGGDLCLGDTIHLKNKEYVFIVNADAMGKSIQGAGGILVLGAVLKSKIERNLLSPLGEDIFPEIWLRDLFTELHRVFIAFEGSMLVSLIMGLVEKDTGLYYYINAEHPWNILYRDHIALFLEKNLFVHKLGFELELRTASVKVFQLKEGDSIIMGSDGKDDIAFMLDQKKVINEDETLFLKVIEKCKGDISLVYSNLLELGEIIDDVSLLKITYTDRDKFKEDHFEKADSLSLYQLIEAEKKEPDHLHLIRLISIKSIQAEQYEIAKYYSEKYLSFKADIIDILFVAAKSNFELKIFDKSLEYSKRFHAREPYDLPNLLLLIKSFISLNENDKALSLVKSSLRVLKKSKELEDLRDKLLRLKK